MSEPTDDVRIDISAPAMVTLSPTSLTFTPLELERCADGDGDGGG